MQLQLQMFVFECYHILFQHSSLRERGNSRHSSIDGRENKTIFRLEFYLLIKLSVNTFYSCSVVIKLLNEMYLFLFVLM
jgi:hypothetical protein